MRGNVRLVIEPIALPSPGAAPRLAGLLDERRSSRSYTSGPLPVEVVAEVVCAAQGGTAGARRTVPSAHAGYGVSVSVAVSRVQSLGSGLYRYAPVDHSLTMVTGEDVVPRLAAACIVDADWVADSAAIVVLSTDFENARTEFADQWPYGQRGERYAWLEAGHISQNVYLACAELGVGVTFVGGVDERMLGERDGRSVVLPPEHELLGMLTLGMLPQR